MQYVILITGIIAAVLEVLCIYQALKNGRRARLIRDTTASKAGHVMPGPAKLTGQAVALTETLAAPLSGKPCVHLRFLVEEKRTRSHAGHGASSSWHTIIDDSQHAPCGLEDETGLIAVDLRGAEIVLHPGKQTKSGTFNSAPEDLERMLKERYGKSSVGWIFNKTMRYTESLIEPGDVLFVAGTVEETPGSNACFTVGRSLLIISDRTEDETQSTYRRKAVFSWVGAVLVLVAAGAALVLFTP